MSCGLSITEQNYFKAMLSTISSSVYWNTGEFETLLKKQGIQAQRSRVFPCGCNITEGTSRDKCRNCHGDGIVYVDAGCISVIAYKNMLREYVYEQDKWIPGSLNILCRPEIDLCVRDRFTFVSMISYHIEVVKMTEVNGVFGGFLTYDIKNLQSATAYVNEETALRQIDNNDVSIEGRRLKVNGGPSSPLTVFEEGTGDSVNIAYMAVRYSYMPIFRVDSIMRENYPVQSSSGKIDYLPKHALCIREQFAEKEQEGDRSITIQNNIQVAC